MDAKWKQITQHPIKQVFVAEKSLERGYDWTESMVGGVVLLFFCKQHDKRDFFLSGLLINFYLGGNFELYWIK